MIIAAAVGIGVTINLLVVFGMRRPAAPIESSIPDLTKDPSGKFNEMRIERMAKVDENLGIKDAEEFRPSGDERVNRYIDEHNARAKQIAMLAFSGESDWTDFYGGDVLPAHAEFVRDGFRFTWKVGPWHRFHWNGRTGWSDTDGGGKFSVDNLNFLFLRTFDPAAFALGEVNKEIEVQQTKDERVVRHVDVLESPDVILMFDCADRTLARSVHPDPEGRRRTYVVDFLGSVDAWKSDGIWIPETISVTFVPRDESRDKSYRVAVYVNEESVIVNGKSVR
jgi:hypothetical protein